MRFNHERELDTLGKNERGFDICNEKKKKKIYIYIYIYIKEIVSTYNICSYWLFFIIRPIYWLIFGVSRYRNSDILFNEKRFYQLTQLELTIWFQRITKMPYLKIKKVKTIFRKQMPKQTDFGGSQSSISKIITFVLLNMFKVTAFYRLLDCIHVLLYKTWTID